MDSTDEGEKRQRGRPRSFDSDAALDQAMLLFWERGYEGTSLADLTAAMGISPPSLYAAFGDKESLFLACVERYGRSAGRHAGAALSAGLGARETLEKILLDSAEEFGSPCHPKGCLVVSSALRSARSNEAVREALSNLRAQNAAAIQACLERGQREGQVAADADCASLALFFASVVQGMSVSAQDGATLEELRRTAQWAMRAWPKPA